MFVAIVCMTGIVMMEIVVFSFILVPSSSSQSSPPVDKKKLKWNVFRDSYNSFLWNACISFFFVAHTKMTWPILFLFCFCFPFLLFPMNIYMILCSLEHVFDFFSFLFLQQHCNDRIFFFCFVFLFQES